MTCEINTFGFSSTTKSPIKRVSRDLTNGMEWDASKGFEVLPDRGVWVCRGVWFLKWRESFD